jgi:hypothetical protein
MEYAIENKLMNPYFDDGYSRFGGSNYEPQVLSDEFKEYGKYIACTSNIKL